MIVYYKEREYWPFRYIVEKKPNIGAKIELTEEEYEDYIQMMDKFEEWQKKLEEKVENG